MGPMAGRWRIDDALAKEVVAAAGTTLDASVDDIATALLRWIPSGSTAKAEALAADRLPPGLDPVAAAEAILGGSTHSWTCWPAATITVGVLHAAGHDATVVAELRTDPGSPPIDVHGAVLVDGHLHVDPCLGPGPAIDLRGDSRTGPSAAAELVPRGDGFDHLVQKPNLQLRYVSLNPDLRPRDLHALLELSATHSGVPTDRRHWQLALPDGVVGVSERDGAVRRRRWRRAGDVWALAEQVEGDFDELVVAARADAAAAAGLSPADPAPPRPHRPPDR